MPPKMVSAIIIAEIGQKTVYPLYEHLQSIRRLRNQGWIHIERTLTSS